MSNNQEARDLTHYFAGALAGVILDKPNKERLCSIFSIDGFRLKPPDTLLVDFNSGLTLRVLVQPVSETYDDS